MSALALDEVLEHLNITDADNLSEIQAMVDAAESIIGNVVGPLEPQDPKTVRVTGTNALLIPEAPVQSATVVAVDGVAPTATLNPRSGVVQISDGYLYSRTYDVTYVAGWATLPADLALAVKEMVRHLWESQRGPSSRPGTNAPVESTRGYLMPYKVQELLEPYRLVGVGAA